VLIMGGIGFIGTRLAARLAAAGARVTILDNLALDAGANPLHADLLRPHADIHIGDIRDTALVTSLLRGQDYLFNLAARIAHSDSMLHPLEDLDVNARAQVTLLDACRTTNPEIRIVHASTRQVYGRPRMLPVSEDHPLQPPDVNAVNKLAGEMFHMLYHQVYGTRSTVLRITNTYGPGMRIRDGRHTFIGLWFRAILEDTPFEVWGGDQFRDLTWVEDVVDACLAATDDRATGEVFNVGGAEPMPLLQLAELLVEVAGRGSFVAIPYPADRAAIEIGSFVADASKIGRMLGWRPRTSLRDGIAETLRYYERFGSSYT